MQKNVASQKFVVFAFDATTNVPKTGDAANITAYISKDYGSVTALGDTSATEMDATNAPGYYLFDATQAETNADFILVSGKSSTANIKVVGAPAPIFTDPPNSSKLTIDSSGRMDLGAISGSSAGADNLKQSTLGIVTGVVGGGSSTTSIVTSSMSPTCTVADQFKGKIITFAEDTTTTNLRGQSTDITANTSGGVLTVTALTTAPVSTDTFAIT